MLRLRGAWCACGAGGARTRTIPEGFVVTWSEGRLAGCCGLGGPRSGGDVRGLVCLRSGRGEDEFDWRTRTIPEGVVVTWSEWCLRGAAGSEARAPGEACGAWCACGVGFEDEFEWEDEDDSRGFVVTWSEWCLRGAAGSEARAPGRRAGLGVLAEGEDEFEWEDEDDWRGMGIILFLRVRFPSLRHCRWGVRRGLFRRAG